MYPIIYIVLTCVLLTKKINWQTMSKYNVLQFQVLCK